MQEWPTANSATLLFSIKIEITFNFRLHSRPIHYCRPFVNLLNAALGLRIPKAMKLFSYLVRSLMQLFARLGIVGKCAECNVSVCDSNLRWRLGEVSNKRQLKLRRRCEVQTI